MVPELPTLNPCPRCNSRNAVYKCIVQDGVLTFMLRPACPDCGFTTEEVFVTETRAAAAWNAIPPERPEPAPAPEAPPVRETLERRIPRMRDEPEISGIGITAARLAEIEAAGDPADIPELVAEIRRLRRDFFGLAEETSEDEGM